MSSKKKTKKFIDPEKSVTFNLVHRSQTDPLVADETAPQRVLVPVIHNRSKLEKKGSKEKKCVQEEQKYEVFFDEEFDYLKHLDDVKTLPKEYPSVKNKDTNNDTHGSTKENHKIMLPSSVFESHVKEEVGLLHKAVTLSGPQLDFDPDIVAAMDDDFDFNNPDNALEDNFIELANQGVFLGSDSENNCSKVFLEEDFSNASDFEGEEMDEIVDLKSKFYPNKDDDSKTYFTEYSMSSSVLRRNEELTLLDNKFEQMYADYDETEIGALDCEEIEGHVEQNSDIILQCTEEYETQLKQDSENVTELMQHYLKIADSEFSNQYENEDTGLENLIVQSREKNKWDCESILSTYSNIYNHPKLISESKNIDKIAINSKTGFPENCLKGRNLPKLTTETLALFEHQQDIRKVNKSNKTGATIQSTTNTFNLRPKNETLEQKKERKQAIKDCRRQRRKERKANTEAFKDQKCKQEQILINQKKNMQGNRIL